MLQRPLIAVVGNCASGKTTLVENLRKAGHNAINVPQEHSEVRRLWKYKKPDMLVLLSCTLETARKRRPGFAWTGKQLKEQYRRLRFAREECDLYIATDDLTRQQVAELVTAHIDAKGEAADG